MQTVCNLFASFIAPAPVSATNEATITEKFEERESFCLKHRVLFKGYFHMGCKCIDPQHPICASLLSESPKKNKGGFLCLSHGKEISSIEDHLSCKIIGGIPRKAGFSPETKKHDGRVNPIPKSSDSDEELYEIKKCVMTNMIEARRLGGFRALAELTLSE